MGGPSGVSGNRPIDQPAAVEARAQPKGTTISITGSSGKPITVTVFKIVPSRLPTREGGDTMSGGVFNLAKMALNSKTPGTQEYFNAHRDAFKRVEAQGGDVYLSIADHKKAGDAGVDWHFVDVAKSTVTELPEVRIAAGSKGGHHHTEVARQAHDALEQRHLGGSQRAGHKHGGAARFKGHHGVSNTDIQNSFDPNKLPKRRNRGG